MTTTLERKKLPASLVPVLALLGISVFINYIDRGNLSIAAPMLKDELGITPARLGVLLSAFFYTYACLLPIYGWLVDRLNVYWMLATCYCIWSLATAATGLVHTFTMLFALRLLVGAGESVSYPSYSKIIALNFSEEHRGIANGCIAAGLALGPGFGMLLGGTLMATFGWRPFFIVLGLISLLWLPPWIKFAPSKNLVPPEDAKHAPSLLEFISLRSAWGSCLHLFCGNYVNYFLLTWLPYFLTRELHFSMTTMAKIGGGGYLVCACGATFAGWMSDRLISSGGSPTVVRKAFAGATLGTAGALLGLCAFVGPTLCIVLLYGAMACFGACSSNIFAISQRLAGPQAAGRWVGFQNGFGNLAGIVAPTVTGYVLGRTGHFFWAFLILTAVTFVGTACMYFLMGPVEQVAWGKKARVQKAFEVGAI
jgi:MFS transporter, ACS family, D-galactonate transporter